MRFSKKGGTDTVVLPEFLRIVLGIMALLVLVYLLYSLYGISTSRTRLEQARATIGELVPKLDNMTSGETGKYVFLAPNKWYFSTTAQTEKVIQQCQSARCLCLCSNDGCDTEVICRATKYSVNLKDKYGNSAETMMFGTPSNFRISLAGDQILMEEV